MRSRYGLNAFSLSSLCPFEDLIGSVQITQKWTEYNLFMNPESFQVECCPC